MRGILTPHAVSSAELVRKGKEFFTQSDTVLGLVRERVSSAESEPKGKVVQMIDVNKKINRNDLEEKLVKSLSPHLMDAWHAGWAVDQTLRMLGELGILKEEMIVPVQDSK